MKLMAKLREAMTAGGYAPGTIERYAAWVVKYIAYHRLRHPAEMGEAEIAQFLNYLAVERRVAACTQNQALAALRLLYENTLNRPLDLRGLRAKRRHGLPQTTGATRAKQAVAALAGRYQLMAGLVYGAGLTVNECSALRAGQVDFSRDTIIINGRETMLPQALKAALLEQAALAGGWTGNVSGYVFPSSRLHNGRCWHVSPSSLQKAMTAATVDWPQRVTPRVLRHSFARHLLEAGYNVRTVQELLGHKSVKTTMVYERLARRGAVSPVDELEE